MPIAVQINGKPVKAIQHEGPEPFPAFAQNEGYPTRDALKFYTIPLDLLVPGSNKIEIKSLDTKKASAQFISLEIALYR